jgi:hypothetical protein
MFGYQVSAIRGAACGVRHAACEVPATRAVEENPMNNQKSKIKKRRSLHLIDELDPCREESPSTRTSIPRHRPVFDLRFSIFDPPLVDGTPIDQSPTAKDQQPC